MTSDDVNSSCRFLSPSNFPWHDEIQYGRARDFIKLGFGPRCLAYGVCWIDQFDLPLLTSVNYVTIKSSFALSATGSVALLVNIAVVLFIIFNKSLRNDLAVRLLLNVAVCDVLIALVGVLCSRFNFSEMYMKTLLDRVQGNNNGKRAFENKRRKLANIMGPILTCAVASHVLGSGISMLDKFLKIVFAMKPDVRLGRKTAVVLLVVSWSLSVTSLCCSAYLSNRGNDVHWPLHSPTHRLNRWQNEAAHWFCVWLTDRPRYLPTRQFSSLRPYLHRRQTIRNKRGSEKRVGNREEDSSAALHQFDFLHYSCRRRCFSTCNIGGSGLFFCYSRLEEPRTRRSPVDVFPVWNFPVLCLSINSLLNPFLYALRHPKLKQQLNPLLSRCWAATRECFGNLRQNLRCHTAIEEPINNEVEMQEGRIPQVASLAEGGNDEVQIQPIHPQCPSHASELNCEV